MNYFVPASNVYFLIYYFTPSGLSKKAKDLYPGWMLRIYYDRSVGKEVKCDIECLKNEKSGDLIDNVDFCDIESIHRDSNTQIPNPIASTWNASYLHAMVFSIKPSFLKSIYQCFV